MRNGWFSSGVSRVVCAAALSGALIAACSATGGNTEFGDSSSENGSGAGNPGGNGGNGGDGGGFIPGAGGNGNQGSGGDDSCAATKNKAEQVPLDMYIMFDQSGSMSDSAGNTSKWNATKNALKAFVEQPSAAGIGVGIQYFPQSSGVMCPLVPFCATDAECGPAACGPCTVPLPGFPGVCEGIGGDSCKAADYAKPDVPIAPLPAVGTTIISSMDNHSPGGGTPTSAALEGAVDYAKQWATQNPTHTVIVVLATDGEPAGCNDDLAYINNIAANALAGVPSIKTFVIGVGNLAGALNGIAAAGGTGSAFIVDANQDATDKFIQAMNEIRGAALSCSYLIPQPPPGEDIDYNAINVEYTPESGISVIIPQVKSEAECPAAGLAWYYDVPGAPKQIILCDATCSQVAKDTKAEIDVLVGCATIVK
ncbi:vWA domain-containing protein [Polyangium jinanense]|uniref:VWA domain-containing protein n=1 Tax=Polyangium jinanense TaxID=2829994 RepID=A0A9X4ARM8_9BACT|nr:vWA domain-containing protein [Polyangium jinanense]MDC3980240.1 VWA domain-containing protein [Polyangium jinanense]